MMNISGMIRIPVGSVSCKSVTHGKHCLRSSFTSLGSTETSICEGKRALIVGVADDQGYGWIIAKALAAAGAQVSVASWVPAHALFLKMLQRGKFDASTSQPNGDTFKFATVYPVDVAYDTMGAVPEEVLMQPKYRDIAAEHDFSIEGLSKAMVRDHGGVDILVHSVGNAPEVQSPLLETTREGYREAMSRSAYSMVSLIQYLGPHMPEGSAALSLTYEASHRVVPGYGGGMSSAKAALESDTLTLAFEAGRKWGIRVNSISAPPLASRAARSIGNVEAMKAATEAVAPLKGPLRPSDVGGAAALLVSDLARGVTGVTLPVDNGAHVASAASAHGGFSLL